MQRSAGAPTATSCAPPIFMAGHPTRPSGIDHLADFGRCRTGRPTGNMCRREHGRHLDGHAPAVRDLLLRLAGPAPSCAARPTSPRAACGPCTRTATSSPAWSRAPSPTASRSIAASAGRSELIAACTCPHGADGRFCKHAVAVALAGSRGRARSARRRTGLRGWLERQRHGFLVDLLAEAAQAEDPTLADRLARAASGRGRPAAAAVGDRPAVAAAPPLVASGVVSDREEDAMRGRGELDADAAAVPAAQRGRVGRTARRPRRRPGLDVRRARRARAPGRRRAARRARDRGGRSRRDAAAQRRRRARAALRGAGHARRARPAQHAPRRRTTTPTSSATPSRARSSRTRRGGRCSRRRSGAWRASARA